MKNEKKHVVLVHFISEKETWKSLSFIFFSFMVNSEEVLAEVAIFIFIVGYFIKFYFICHASFRLNW